MTRPLGVAMLVVSLVPINCVTAHGARHLAGLHTSALPFAASSMPSGYGIQVRLEGSATVRDDWLYVVVPTGSVRTYQGTADAWDLMVRAGLATCTDKGAWRIVSESRAVRIAPLIGMTRDDAMLDTTVRAFKDTLRLDLGVPRTTTLDRSWLTFELAWPIQSVLARYTLSANGTLTPVSERTDAKRPSAVCGATSGRRPR
jgi:hypothetical protein